MTFLVCIADGGGMLGLHIALIGAAGSLLLPFIGACIYPLVERTRRGVLSAALCLVPLGAAFGYVYLMFELFRRIE